MEGREKIAVLAMAEHYSEARSRLQWIRCSLLSLNPSSLRSHYEESQPEATSFSDGEALKMHSRSSTTPPVLFGERFPKRPQEAISRSSLCCV